MQTTKKLDIDHPAIELLSYYMGLLNPVQDILENLYRLSFEEGRFGNSEWSSTLA
ncbi:hypothetical protein HNQ10_003936 [Deinococcus metallilatus]|uniref:Uncharacterized protein n=1 Tax=Deinococcus metallilatus TaxID=1211322 RepID=A0ABR6N0A7_9DEIO|nr:hypothetical protein [Deinococcus metallilatus]GMA17322.1 hypothetical protein GCM10025871_36530 [Deinococcus metallilatus]